MALPPQVIDQLSREPARTPGWSGRLLMFSFTLFFLAAIAWVGLSQGYERYLDSQDKKIQKELDSGSAQIPKDKESSLIGFYSQLDNLKNILDKHVYASNLFGFLEQTTHSNVYFTKLDLNSELNKVTLSGVAKTVKDATEQAQVFQGNEQVKSVILGNLAVLADGTWQFDLSLVLQDKFLNQAKIFGPSLSAPVQPGSQPATSTPSSTLTTASKTVTSTATTTNPSR
jgi:hypothetical protein